MRLHILSDLHLEFGPRDISPAAGADAVILAGDIHTKLNGLKWILEHLPGLPVLYVTGNHEYYGEKLPSLLTKLQEHSAGTPITVLENGVVALQGYRFFGATLWTDLRLHGDLGAASVEALRMNDYKRIRTFPTYRRLTPAGTAARHHVTMAALRDFMDSGDPDKSIIITHHAPSALSLPPARRPELISAAYASHLEGFIQATRPRLWIHGHIHHSRDYRIGRTRIVSNPRGYCDSPNPAFNPELVLDLAAD